MLVITTFCCLSSCTYRLLSFHLPFPSFDPTPNLVLQIWCRQNMASGTLRFLYNTPTHPRSPKSSTLQFQTEKVNEGRKGETYWSDNIKSIKEYACLPACICLSVCLCLQVSRLTQKETRDTQMDSCILAGWLTSFKWLFPVISRFVAAHSCGLNLAPQGWRRCPFVLYDLCKYMQEHQLAISVLEEGLVTSRGLEVCTCPFPLSGSYLSLNPHFLIRFWPQWL